MHIKFHCDETSNFKSPTNLVRAFTYTEYSIDQHTHDFYELNIVMGGRGTHQIDNAVFNVKLGDVFVIPPNTIHAYYNTERLEVYHILLKKDFIAKNRSEANTMPGFLKFFEIEPFLRQNSSASIFLNLNLHQLAEIKNELKFIEDNGAFDRKEMSALHNHVAWKIIYYCSYLLHNQIERDKKSMPKKYEHLILDTLEYLHQHFSEKITINSLSTRIYLSRSTFLRSFQEICGCSPIEYLNQYRIKKALELAENSTMSKTEIAHYCGFYDLSHMERTLKNN